MDLWNGRTDNESRNRDDLSIGDQFNRVLSMNEAITPTTKGGPYGQVQDVWNFKSLKARP
jgi:hypothetical protein